MLKPNLKFRTGTNLVDQEDSTTLSTITKSWQKDRVQNRNKNKRGRLGEKWWLKWALFAMVVAAVR